jgi:polyhydroxyalkanoate synthesis regulator phasin
MLATPHRLRSSALTASFLLAVFGTAFAAEPADDVKALKQQITDLTNQQAANNTAVQGQLKTIGETLDNLRKSMDLLVQKNNGDVTALKGQIEKLQSDVLTLQRQIEAMPHESRKVTANSVTPVTPVAPKGRIQITNQYPSQVDYVINGMSYPVPSGQSLTLEYPAGTTFTYSVMQIPEPARTRALRENETLIVTVTPRQ